MGANLSGKSWPYETCGARIFRLFLTLNLLAVSTVGVAAGSTTVLLNWQSHVTPRALQVWKSASSTSPIAASNSISTTRYDAKGRLQIDVTFDCATATVSEGLVAAGMVIGTNLKVPPTCVIEGWAPTSALPTIASLSGVNNIDLPHYARQPAPITSSGHSITRTSGLPQAASGTPVIDGNGITIMNADKYIAQTGANGAGITIGVINQGADSLSVIQGRGELPTVNVVQPSANPPPPANEDEGTMMLEEVYAVAPGANLAFCGPQTYTEYVACVKALIAAKVTIITDDLGFPGYDVMSAPAENGGTQLVETLLAANPGVMLFSAAENQAENYWQGSYAPATFASGRTFACQGQTDTYFENFTGTNLANIWTVGGSTTPLALAWANANGVSSANYDLYVTDTSFNVVACAAGSGSTEVSGSTTYDAIDASKFSTPSTYYIFIGTPDASLAGNFLKLLGFGDGADTWSSITPGSTSSPQDFAAGAFPIGAVNGANGVGNTIEPFSATGPIQFEVPTKSTLQSPVLVAPDKIYVDNVGTSFSTDLFGGTSAASPNAAAVAGLLRSAFPTLTPAQTIQAMETGAAVLGGSAPNGNFGYGRVDALGALGALPAPTIAKIAAASIVGGTSGTVPLTLSGTGTLTITTSSDTTALVSSTAPGITVSPSTCGAPTLACSLVITPTLGKTGTANITVSVADGAKRTASATFAATVTKPAPPTVGVTAGASQSITEGGATTPVSFTVAGTPTLSVTVASSNTTLLPASGIALTSGCGGKSSSSCTATLTVASGQTGTSTITITASDPYGQSGTATATVTVNAPSSGKGGGSLDVMSLLALAAFALWQAYARRESLR